MRDRIDLNKVSFFCVSDKNYLENTFVTLSSYFDFNTHEVTLYVFDCEDKDLEKFKKFENLKIKKLEKVEIPKNKCYEYYRDTINFISAKIRIFDILNGHYDYALCFDTDSIFLGNVENVFENLNTEVELLGVEENWIDYEYKPLTYRTKPYLNVGFLIIKLNYTENLFKEYLNFLNSGKHTQCPEQDFLNYHFKKRDIIPTKYNFLINNHDVIDDIRFVHFCSTIKPFNISIDELMITIKRYNDYLRFFNKYYKYIEKIDISDEFNNKCMSVNKKINILRYVQKRCNNESKI